MVSGSVVMTSDNSSGERRQRRGGGEFDVEYYRITPDASEAEFLAIARVYARDVVSEFDLSVNVSALEWEVSNRAKRRSGAVKHRDGDPESISLTWEYFEAKGWEAVAATIRHELIHAHLLTEYDDGSHGDRFVEWADRLQTSVRCERFSPPNWWVVCESCGEKLARYRQSKLVTEPDRYSCGSCGGRFVVTENSTD